MVLSPYPRRGGSDAGSQQHIFLWTIYTVHFHFDRLEISIEATGKFWVDCRDDCNS